ncbi:MAG: DegT/DnrJ/EryC1/StrS family aminotransferase [Phycisphaerae bacterium]|nr:DegT/DnrJ/EryC1/StrS family aminotransferase [Phycisphaerae bacterium]
MTTTTHDTQPTTPTRTIPFGRPLIDQAEKDAVLRVLDGPILTHGPLVKQFEADFAAFTGAEHAVATSSCAAALHLACLALGIGRGDEVLVSAQTHVATAHAVELVGAECVFVDSEPRTGNIDPDLIEPALTERTKAIALVHYLGFAADMDRIMPIAERHRLAVIEDCAIALGTTTGGKHVGLIGDAGCFSFYPVKAMTTGEGGMLITRRDDVARAASQYRAFGIDRNVVAERPIPGMYDVQMLGLNYRLNEIGAALGIEQLKKLPEFLRIRRRNFNALAAGLAGIEGIQVLGADEPVETAGCYCLVAMLDDALRDRRIDLIEALKTRGVGTSIYYPRPVPRMTYYRDKYDTRDDDTPVAARISDASLALPVGPHVCPEDVDYMITAVAAAVEEVRKV